MASQITHVPYSKKVLDLFLSDRRIDLREFYCGALFPDIRYLGKLNREDSHFFHTSIYDLRKIDDSFRLGFYTHSLIDEERERVVKKLNIDSLIPDQPLVGTIMKFLEDLVTFPMFDRWSEVIEYLEKPVSGELEILSKEVVMKWHRKLQNYFSRPPEIETALDLISGTTISEEQKSNGVALIKVMRENNELMEKIKLIYDNLFK